MFYVVLKYFLDSISGVNVLDSFINVEDIKIKEFEIYLGKVASFLDGGRKLLRQRSLIYKWYLKIKMEAG